MMRKCVRPQVCQGGSDGHCLRLRTEGNQLLLHTPRPHAGRLVDALRNLESTQLNQLSQCLQRVITQMREMSATASGETLMGE
jgi:hypothetical protein